MKTKRIITALLMASAAVMLAIVFKASVHAQGDSGGGVPVKHYNCVFYTGGMLQSVAPFTITGPGTYTDRDGKKGTYTYDSESSSLTFHGGNYDGARADCVTKDGKMTIYLLQDGHRSGITCN